MDPDKEQFCFKKTENRPQDVRDYLYTLKTDLMKSKSVPERDFQCKNIQDKGMEKPSELWDSNFNRDGSGDTAGAEEFNHNQSSNFSQPASMTISGEGDTSDDYKTDINHVSFASNCLNDVRTIPESELVKDTIGLENLKLAPPEQEGNAYKLTFSPTEKKSDSANTLTVTESTIKEIELRSQKKYAQELKQLGNDAFKRKDYANAINFYCKAIKCDPEDPILYGNRAQAYIYIQLYLKAIADCDIALSLDPTYVKALFRRAQARVRNKDLENARTDFILVLKMDPGNKEAQKMLVEVNTQIQHLAYEIATAKAQPKPSRKKPQTPPPFVECVPVSTWLEPEKPIRILQKPKVTRIDASYTCIVPEIGENKEPVPEFPKVILPIVKPPEKQSKRPLIGIHVKVVGNEEQIKAKAEAEAAEKARLEAQRKELEAMERERILNSEIPKPPKTSIQFGLDWKSLVSYPERAALYLKQMTPDDFNIFKLTSIDCQVLAEIIDVLVWEFMRNDWDYNQQLEGIARIGRLGTLLLMFEEKDSCALRKLLYECGNKDLQDYFKNTYNVGPL